MHPNAEVARRAYDAFLTGDLVTMDELMSESIVWHSAGSNPLSGTYRGKEETLGLFAEIAQRSDAPMEMVLHDVLAGDDHVVALVQIKASRGGSTFTDNAVHIMHITDGKISEFWNRLEDQAAGDEFWS